MIDLLIDNKVITEVKSYKEAYEVTKKQYGKGKLEFASDREMGLLYFKFTTKETK